MKRIIPLLTIPLITSFYLKSQNYQTLYSDIIPYYESQNKWIKCIRIDSVKYQKDTIFYPFSNIQQIEYECLTPSGPSWIGSKVIIQNTDYNLFFNIQDDTIKIKTNASLNEKWTAYELLDSTIIIATVIKQDTLKFLNLLDSVKTIGFQVYNKNLIPISHVLNNMTLLLSKNYGFVRIFNFYLFPDYNINFPEFELQEYNLVGLSKPQIGIQNLTWFDVYDFQVEDEIHILYKESWWGSSNDYSTTHKTIIKYLLRNDYTDSIVYEIEIERSKYKIWYDSNTSSYDYIHDIRKSLIVPDSIFDKLPGEPIISEYEACSYYMINDINLSKTEPSGYEKICLFSDTCWTYCDVWGCWPSYSYIKGLGGPYYGCDNFTFMQENKLVYYKKGNKTWGTPLIISDIKDTKLDKDILMFPNPTKDILWIKIINLDLPLTFELFNIKGQIIVKKDIVSEVSSISIKSYNKGIYMYRILGNSGIVKCDKIIIE